MRLTRWPQQSETTNGNSPNPTRERSDVRLPQGPLYTALAPALAPRFGAGCEEPHGGPTNSMIFTRILRCDPDNAASWTPRRVNTAQAPCFAVVGEVAT